MATRRRWLQFSLRGFIVVVTIGCVWLTSLARHTKEEREAIDMIHRAYGSVEYEPTLMSSLGLSQGRPTKALFLGADARRIAFDKLQTLKSLRQINFKGTAIHDSHLRHLIEMKHLEFINLADTNVTRSGIRQLHSALPRTLIESKYGNGILLNGPNNRFVAPGLALDPDDPLSKQSLPVSVWEPPHNLDHDQQEKALLDSLGPSLDQSND